MFKGITVFDMKLYDFFNTISTVVFFLFNYFHLYKKKDILSNASLITINHLSGTKLNFLANVYIWAFLETTIFSYIQYIPAYNRVAGDYFETGANYFGMLTLSPLALIIFFFIISLDPCKQMDLLTPGLPLCMVFVKIACFCSGCCNGMAWEHGFYNKATECVEFPLQILEGVVALLIFVFFMIYRKKAKPGTLFPLYMIIYSFTRFLTEFLSDEPIVVWILKKYHLICLAGVAVGIVLLLVAIFLGDKISHIFLRYGLLSGKLGDVYADIQFSYYKLKKKFIYFVTKEEKSAVHHKKHKKKNQKRIKNRK